MNFKKVCVIGLGYIGLPTAATFAKCRMQVIGVDINPHIVQTLRKNEIHIFEPGLQELVQAALESGNLVVQSEPEISDAFIIAVPTPFYSEKLADMSFVVSAVESILPYLHKGALVVLESTSPPQTTAKLVQPILERSGLYAGEDFFLAYSPERVLPGKILRELIENARVIGGINIESARAGRDLYSAFVKGEIILSDATTAEMVKLMENTFRDVNIAVANEFARLADRFGVDVWEAITIANRHPRVKILNPGPGVGGHCISVDPWFLVEAAPDLTPLIHTARKVNDTQPHFVISLVKRALSSLENRRITVLGLAYKPDVDDLRESPAVEIAQQLSEAGALVKAFEPFKPEASFAGIKCCSNIEEALVDAEMIILLVAHTSLCALTPQELNQLSPARILLDTVNGWNGSNWATSGFQYIRLGDTKQ